MRNATRGTTVRVALVGVLALVAARADRVLAEDERGRWTLGFGLGVHSTFDDIRSNSAEVISCEARGCSTLPSDGDLSNDLVVTFDPRNDDLLGRATKIEEKQRFDFSAAYGLTSWLSLQVETGLYQGSVAPLDVLAITERWAQPVGITSFQKTPVVQEGVSNPLTVGRLTQIPISINALIRFRKDSPFNPFLGLGVGYMFNNVSLNESYNDLNSEILRGFSRVMSDPDAPGDQLVNTQEIYSGFITLENASSQPGGSAVAVYNVDCTDIGVDKPGITNTCTSNDRDPRRFEAIPTQPFIRTTVNDGFLYQVSVGADYHFNERWSAYVAARYLVTDAKVAVKIEGTDPNLGPFSLDQATFRFIAETNPPAAGQGENRFQRCTPDPVSCTDPAIARTQTLQERVLVQGGQISLSAFTLGAGVRFSF